MTLTWRHLLAIGNLGLAVGALIGVHAPDVAIALSVGIGIVTAGILIITAPNASGNPPPAGR